MLSAAVEMRDNFNDPLHFKETFVALIKCDSVMILKTMYILRTDGKLD